MKSGMYKDFKKVSEDDRVATLAHPNGHKIQIAKQGLSHKLKRELSALPLYAEGGEVEEPERAPAAAPAPQPPVVINVGSPQPQMPAPVEAPQPVARPQMGGMYGAPQAQAPAPDEEGFSPQELSAANKSLQEVRGQAPQPASQAPAAPEPSLAPQAPGAPQNPMMPDASMYAQAPGFQEQAAAEKGLGQVNEKALAEQAKVYQQHAAQEQQHMQMLQEDLHDKMSEIKNVTEDIRNGHINPNQYLENMEAGQKVRTAIGLILGGIGGGILHQENPVMKHLNSQIENDLKAQEKNMNQKNNLLTALEHQYKDKVVAADMFRVIRANILSDQINQAAMASGSQAAKLNAMKATGILKEKYMPLVQKAAVFSTIGRLRGGSTGATGSGGNADQVSAMIDRIEMYDPEKGKALRARFVPGVGLAGRDVPDASLKEIQAKQHLDEAIEDLKKFSKENSGTVLDVSAIEHGKAKAKLVNQLMRQTSKEGVFREGENKFNEAIIDPDPTKWLSKYRVIPGLEELQRNNRADLAGLHKTYELPPPKFSMEPVERMTKDGKTALFDPSTKKFLGYK